MSAIAEDRAIINTVPIGVVGGAIAMVCHSAIALRFGIERHDQFNCTPRSAEERNLGLVFQSYALWPHKMVFDNIA